MGFCCSKTSEVSQPMKSLLSLYSEFNESSSPLLQQFGCVQYENIQKYYTLRDHIGTGHFGSVRIATRIDGVPGEKYAVKSIAKVKVSDIKRLAQELEILHSVDHPNIIKLFEVYIDALYIHLVTELCTGGELFERLIRKGRYSEPEASSIVYKVLHAINHLHKLGFVHRDIKPENILYSHEGDEAEIKLIDFGLSTKFKEDDEMHSLVGTPYYVAPEVLKKRYGPECDVWSAGILMHFLLYGHPPFVGETEAEVFQKIVSSDFSLQEDKSISELATDLLKRLLVKSRKNRITAADALDHEWFTRASNNIKDKKILKRISRYKAGNQLRKELLSLVARQLKPEEINRLNSTFRELDKDHTGYISLEGLQDALGTLKVTLKDDANLIFKRVGSQDRIRYTEFLCAAMDRRVLLSKEVRWMAFKFFDSDDKGYITLENMKYALKKLDTSITDQEILNQLGEAGLKYENWIEFHEFCKLLNPYPDDISSLSSVPEVD